MKVIRERISAIHGEDVGGEQERRVMVFYFEIFFKPKMQQGSLKLSVEREMLTLVTAIDSLLCGDLHRTADILMGRFKALEEATTSQAGR